jgi:hypothetical protein
MLLLLPLPPLQQPPLGRLPLPLPPLLPLPRQRQQRQQLPIC